MKKIFKFIQNIYQDVRSEVESVTLYDIYNLCEAAMDTDVTDKEFREMFLNTIGKHAKVR